MTTVQRKIEKPWGHEIIWAQTEKYIGKILFIKNGHKLSRQYHILKEETILINSGILSLEVGSKEYTKIITLKKGEHFHITPNTIHRFRADHGDVEIFEVSTSELDDVVRLEDDYGRINNFSLQEN